MAHGQLKSAAADLIQARQQAKVDAKASSLADAADAGVKAHGRVRLNYYRAGQSLVLHFPAGTDVWTVLKRVDDWVNAPK